MSLNTFLPSAPKLQLEPDDVEQDHTALPRNKASDRRFFLRRNKAMPTQWWDKTLTLETKHLGRAVTINSTERAADFLLHEWPQQETGKAYEAAKRALTAAHDGTITPQEVREAVIAAAREDGVFVYEERGHAAPRKNRSGATLAGR
jgi:glycine/D-amino acid oxidase-like deaminating enzyme